MPHARTVSCCGSHRSSMLFAHAFTARITASLLRHIITTSTTTSGSRELRSNLQVPLVSDRRCLDDVANDKFLDRFVLGRATCAVSATHGLHVTATLLRPTIISPFFRHFNVLN